MIYEVFKKSLKEKKRNIRLIYYIKCTLPRYDKVYHINTIPLSKSPEYELGILNQTIYYNQTLSKNPILQFN